MKFYMLLMLLLIAVADSYCQQSSNFYGRVNVEITKEKKPKRIYARLTINTIPPGRDSAWLQSIQDNINSSLPYRNGARPGKYYAFVLFIVTKDGSLSDVICRTDPGFGMCEKIVKVIKKEPGRRWIPAAQPATKP